MARTAAVDRGRGKRVFLLVLAGALTLLFVALCVWQVERRAWKLALIAAVDARVHAPVAPVPAPARWPSLSRSEDEYRHVSATGQLLDGRETLVQALTEAGPGYWVMTPLRMHDGATVLVNLGFVSTQQRDPRSRRDHTRGGEVRIIGLLRMSEPRGRFLRANRPGEDRWYSRDVDAIAGKRGIGPVAPFFIDADARPNAHGGPIGGLTIVSFPNNHLTYALTWFGLALLSATGFVIVWRSRDPQRTARTGESGTAVSSRESRPDESPGAVAL